MKPRKELNWIQKMWFDCTTNPKNGEYSLGRLQPVWATFMVTFLSLLFVVEVHIWPDQEFRFKEPPIELVYAWGLVALGLVVAFLKDKSGARNLLGKIIDNNNEPVNEEQNG